MFDATYNISTHRYSNMFGGILDQIYLDVFTNIKKKSNASKMSKIVSIISIMKIIKIWQNIYLDY
jgi:hypothetical protein